MAEPYLRGFHARAERGSRLHGFWFELNRKNDPETSMGFFVGYALESPGLEFLSPQPPECLVFAFVQPVAGETYRRLVAEPESLARKTFEYIRWLTHRPPRFQFFEHELAALVRHRPMRDWPSAKRAHYSRNFFIETLAWLVRSGLVRNLIADADACPAPCEPSARHLKSKNSPQTGKSGHRKARLSS